MVKLLITEVILWPDATELQAKCPQPTTEWPIPTFCRINPIEDQDEIVILKLQAIWQVFLGMLNAVPYGHFIKQKADYLEQMTGRNRQNKYKVYVSDNGCERNGKEILYCKETSN